MPIIIFILFMLLTATTYAVDDSCIVNGSYDGYRCGVDVNGNGRIDDCSEMQLCKRPDGGTCTGSAQTGYICDLNGVNYATAVQCQNACGGTKDFTCPTDMYDPVCIDQTEFTQRTYMELDPGNFENTTTYMFARTRSSEHTEHSYLTLPSYDGHPADRRYRNHIITNYGNGPFWVDGGVLYSDAFFGRYYKFPCYYYESYDNSKWRPKDYCPGNNCAHYQVSSTGVIQSWEKYTTSCVPTKICQSISHSVFIPYSIQLTVKVWDGTQEVLITSNIGFYLQDMNGNSNAFSYNNSHVMLYNNNWYGMELHCIGATTIEGIQVCTQYTHRIYGPEGQGPAYPFDSTTTFVTTGAGSESVDYWVGPANTTGSFHVYNNIYGRYTGSLYDGYICHDVGLDSATYNNTQPIANGRSITTQCVASTQTRQTCTEPAHNICTNYQQCIDGACGNLVPNGCSFGYIYITTTGNNPLKFSISSTTKASITSESIIEYRDIPGYLPGIWQWDFVKCRPCLDSSSGVIIDDPATPPDTPIDQTKACTNFKMFNGLTRKCRPWSISTLLLADCCDLSGWLKSWCKSEEMELKKRRQAGTCHRVGRYCSKKIKFLGICLEEKDSFCCFSSKLARIIHEQGRPQIGKTWGRTKSPDCSGFTPTEFSKLDFSSMDLSEWIADIQQNIDTSVLTGEITKGIQEWMQKQQNPSMYNKEN